MQTIINLCHAIKVNPLKMKDCQSVLATVKTYHLIKHDKSMPVFPLKEMKGKGRRPEECKFKKQNKKTPQNQENKKCAQ